MSTDLKALRARLADVRARRNTLPARDAAAAALIRAGKPITADLFLAADLLDLEARALEMLLATDSRTALLEQEAAFIASAAAEADALLAAPPGKSYEDRQRLDKARERVHMAAQKIGAASRGGERIPTPHGFADLLDRVSALSLLMAPAATVPSKEA